MISIEFITRAIAITSLVICTIVAFAQQNVRDGLAFSADFPWTQALSTMLLTLTGIFFGSLFRALQGRSESIAPLAEIRRVLSSSSFWAALSVSPFVFATTFVIISESPSGLSSYLLCFQNGFFWENIFKRTSIGSV